MKLQTHDLSYFLCKNFFGDDGSQNRFVYQLILDTLELNKDKSTDYVLSRKSKEVHTFKLNLLKIAFLYSIKLSGYKVGIKFDKDPFVVEKDNCATKIVYTNIVYDLDALTRNSTNNFKFKNCLFGAATNIVKNSDKEKLVYSGYGIAFDGARS